jgi:hypothetical protein
MIERKEEKGSRTRTLKRRKKKEGEEQHDRQCINKEKRRGA